MRAALLLLAAPLGFAGCLFPSFDGATSASDASTDAATLDAPSDTSADGAPDAGGPFCTTLVPAPTFCADFDQGDFPAGFDSLASWGLATGILDKGTLGDPTRSFHAFIPALTGSDQGSANLVKAFAMTPKTLRVELDYLPLALESTERGLVSIVFGGGADPMTLLLSDSGARVAEAGDLADGGVVYGGGVLAHGVTVGTWTHVRWVITIGATSSSSSVSLDSDAVEFDPVHAQDYPSGPEVSVGLLFVGAPSTGWDARIDNVVIDIQ